LEKRYKGSKLASTEGKLSWNGLKEKYLDRLESKERERMKQTEEPVYEVASSGESSADEAGP